MARQAKTKLLESIPDDYQAEYLNMETVADIWFSVRKKYAIKSPNLCLKTLHELDNLKLLSDHGDRDAHIAKINSLYQRFRTLQEDVTEANQRPAFLIIT